MDARQRKRWVAALKALRTASAASGMAGEQLRSWALDTLAAMPSADLDAGSRDAIADAFLAAIQPGVSLVPAAARLPVFMSFDKLEARELEQMMSRYAAPAPGELANPYSSPASYLLHPTIDVLDQETIRKISSRDTGA